jgi:2-keto-4-pentenoate hydratase/2-oxohepta-3-ene-1,7-dioic acid hydratase in catechol pathway
MHLEGENIMKLVTFSVGGGKLRAGALIAGGLQVLDLVSAAEAAGDGPTDHYSSVLSLIEAGDDAFERAKEFVSKPASSATIQRDGARLHAPLQPPPQMRDCLCFEQHLIDAFKELRRVRASSSSDPAAAMREMEAKNILGIPEVFYEQPIYYKANRFSVIGTDEDVIWPHYSNVLDFELEFGCYIRKPAYDVKAANARDYIFGYTIFNDISARDTQTKEMPGQLGPAKSKDFDTGNCMGPCLVTYDELRDPYDLTMIARVNGEEWGRGSSSTSIFPHRKPYIPASSSVQAQSVRDADLRRHAFSPQAMSLNLRWRASVLCVTVSFGGICKPFVGVLSTLES